MTDTLQAASKPNTGPWGSRGRKRKYGPYNTAHLPTEAELAEQPHTGEAADTNSLFTLEQVEQETRTVRLDISFSDVVRIRDQAEMVMAACRLIIGKTREHEIGSIRQRIDCRREAASLGRALARFNGKTPYGDTRRKPRQY